MWTQTIPTPTSITSLPNHRRLPVIPKAGKELLHVGSGLASTATNTKPSLKAQKQQQKKKVNTMTTNTKQREQQSLEPEKKEQQEEEDKVKELSGADILWALQKVNDRNVKPTKQNLQRRNEGKSGSGSSSGSGSGSDKKRVVDYDKARPLTSKSEWATRLDDLQKRLQEFRGI